MKTTKKKKKDIAVEETILSILLLLFLLLLVRQEDFLEATIVVLATAVVVIVSLPAIFLQFEFSLKVLPRLTRNFFFSFPFFLASMLYFTKSFPCFSTLDPFSPWDLPISLNSRTTGYAPHSKKPLKNQSTSSENHTEPSGWSSIRRLPFVRTVIYNTRMDVR